MTFGLYFVGVKGVATAPLPYTAHLRNGSSPQPSSGRCIHARHVRGVIGLSHRPRGSGSADDCSTVCGYRMPDREMCTGIAQVRDLPRLFCHWSSPDSRLI